MSHAYSPRRAELYRAAERARRARQHARRTARFTKAIQTGAIALPALTPAR